MRDDIHKITIELQRPRGSFPGRVEVGHYVVVEGSVVLTDDKGKPISDAKRPILKGEDARLIECAMLRQRSGRNRGSSFNRPISYPRSWKGV
jgi:hypothetical protein